jgi:hypothetical protein
VLLFAISVTGLMLTASYSWMKGYAYDFLAILHAMTVIVTLLYLPFGKLFHISPASGAAGRQLLQGCRGAGEQARLPPLRPAICVGDDGARSRERRARARFSYEMNPRRERITISRSVRAAGARSSDSRRARMGRQRLEDDGFPRASRSEMATIPVDELRIIERTGPASVDADRARLSTSAEPERLVKTHCCFCGQQCGIQLKVLDNEVIGFEPWEEFPFNRGMLCPKGVKRYLQGAHPDR